MDNSLVRSSDDYDELILNTPKKKRNESNLIIPNKPMKIRKALYDKNELKDVKKKLIFE